jgi:hypothetical protein
MKMKVNDPNARGFVAEREGLIVGTFLNFFPQASVNAVKLGDKVSIVVEQTGLHRLILLYHSA